MDHNFDSVNLLVCSLWTSMWFGVAWGLRLSRTLQTVWLVDRGVSVLSF